MKSMISFAIALLAVFTGNAHAFECSYDHRDMDGGVTEIQFTKYAPKNFIITVSQQWGTPEDQSKGVAIVYRGRTYSNADCDALGSSSAIFKCSTETVGGPAALTSAFISAPSGTPGLSISIDDKSLGEPALRKVWVPLSACDWNRNPTF